MLNEKDPNKEQKDRETPKKIKIEKAENEITKIEIKDFEDLQNLINSIDENGNKRTKLHLVSRFVKNPIINCLIYLVLNLGLIVAALGYTSFITFDSFYKVLIYLAGFTLIEVVTCEIIYYFFPLYALMTFGQTISVLLIIGSVAYCYFMPGVECRSLFVLIPVIIVITILKRFLINYLHLNFNIFKNRTQ